jgi:hypothetical protein
VLVSAGKIQNFLWRPLIYERWNVPPNRRRGWYLAALLPRRRELLANGQPIKLGGRGFDVLMALIEAPHRVLTGDLSKSIE